MATIGIFDSGIGGLSVLREVIKLLPEENYIYYADNANCPYGDKSLDFITDRCRSITDILTGKGADIIVVACNTATGAAIASLRNEYDIPFVGMEPAVKPAALGTRTGTIGVLATKGTLHASKYLDTKGRYEDSVNIVEHIGEGFVELVENMEFTGPHAEEVVSKSLTPLLEAGADTIVLGCTHYPFLIETLTKLAGPRIKIINPAPAVAARLLFILQEKGLIPSTSTPSPKSPEKNLEALASGRRDVMDKLIEVIL